MKVKPCLPEIEIPSTIGTRTTGLEPLLKVWANQNRGVPWSVLLQRGLKHELRELAGKRHAHILEDK